MFLKSPHVAQVFLYGDSLQSCVVAIVVPNPGHIKELVAQQGLAGSTLEEWLAHAPVQKAVEADMLRVAKEAGLQSFEQAKAVHLHPEPFTPENDLLTPTFKLKRNVAKERFQAVIDALYEKSGMGVVAGKAGLKQVRYIHVPGLLACFPLPVCVCVCVCVCV